MFNVFNVAVDVQVGFLFQLSKIEGSVSRTALLL